MQAKSLYEMLIQKQQITALNKIERLNLDRPTLNKSKSYVKSKVVSGTTTNKEKTAITTPIKD